jgi:HEPN domain-containing protein
MGLGRACGGWADPGPDLVPDLSSNAGTDGTKAALVLAGRESQDKTIYSFDSILKDRAVRRFLRMAPDSDEWFRQAQYDLGTAESLVSAERYPPVIFYCHLALEKALKALYVEKFNDAPNKTHSLVFLVEILELELPQKSMDSLFVINRIGITGRYPHNLDEVLEQYTKEKTEKILRESKEILTWLMQKSSKR